MLARLQHILCSDAQVIATSLLVDAEDAMDNGPQAPHLDFLLTGSSAEKYTIVVPERAAGDWAPEYSLFLYPRSHTVMKDAAEFHGWDEKDGFKHSSEELDRAFSSELPVYEPVRLILKPGQVLICDGRLVHGGGLVILHAHSWDLRCK